MARRGVSMIEEKEYKKRREILANKIKNNSIALLFSNSAQTRSNDTEFPYRQNSNFYYMTGFQEEGSCLMFVKKDHIIKTVLFVAKKIPSQELWNGKRLGVVGAKKRFDVDEVYEYTKFSELFKTSVEGMVNVYYDFALDYSKVKILKRYGKKIRAYKNLAFAVQKMRLIKSASEIALIKKGLSITQEAHHKAMKLAKNLEYEYQLQAEIEYVFKSRGAYSDAYSSIVASGNNANTLHYIRNDKKLHTKELILIDAGCEYNYYATDITRTIPKSGKFSAAQKELYEMVLSVQLEVLSMIQPKVKRSDLQKKAIKLLTQGMIRLNILKGSLKKNIKKERYKRYYPHGIGHWMGIDVHDEAPYITKKSKEIALQEGMVLTIEPGIYLDKNDTRIPKKFRGIGIRIEDNILITKNGYENLSAGIAKSVAEIERIAYS
jgi:Xaa-Pro aminopeptidase